MRFLADENLPGRLVAALRAAGHDVAWVRTEAPGSDDRTVLAMAAAEQRVLVTFDKDFGELAGRAGLPMASGVILLRVPLDRAPGWLSDRHVDRRSRRLGGPFFRHRAGARAHARIGNGTVTIHDSDRGRSLPCAINISKERTIARRNG